LLTPVSGSKRPPDPTRTYAVPFRVILAFLLYLLAGTFALLLPAIDRMFVTPWTEANASSAAALASALGQKTYVNGTVLTSSGGRMSVKNGCNGVEAFVILVSAVLASPVGIGRRFLGVLVGAAAVFGLNILRLLNLLFVLVHYPQRLDFFHIYIWQTLIVLLAFGVFMFWGAFLAGRR
jgi:exosortase/archaeosortase family protein